MTEYRIPISSFVSQDTLRFMDDYKLSQTEKLSRGEVIDRAVALLAAQTGRKSGKATK